MAVPNASDQVALRFQKRINDLIRDFDELMLAVYQKRRQASLENLLAEQTVMSMAVFWEAFIHDVFVAHVVATPDSCLADIEKRLLQSIADKFAGISRWVTITRPDSINRAQAEKILDPKGWNVVPDSAQGLAELANRHLAASDAKKFSLSAEDREFVDYLVSLRNYLVHRSNASRQKLALAIRNLDAAGANSGLIGNANLIATYLKQKPAAQTRVAIVGQRMSTIAGKLS